MTTVIDLMEVYGVAIIDFPTVFGVEKWEKLKAAMDKFLTSERYLVQLEAYQKKVLGPQGDKTEKDYLLRLLGGFGEKKVEIEADDPWLEFSKDKNLLELASGYFLGGTPKLAYFDLWHTIPVQGLDRTGSQNWHIDYEAQGYPRRIFKAFLYFTDCMETGAGPLEVHSFVGSTAKGLSGAITVPAGSMVFVDTGRLVHRGGYCTTKPRTLAVWYFTNGSPYTVPPLVLTPRHKVLERSA